MSPFLLVRKEAPGIRTTARNVQTPKPLADRVACISAPATLCDRDAPDAAAHLHAVRGDLRHRRRDRRRPGRLHPRRRGRSVQPRPHLPQGGRADGSARRSRSPRASRMRRAPAAIAASRSRGTRRSTRRRERLAAVQQHARPRRGRRSTSATRPCTATRRSCCPCRVRAARRCGTRSRFSATSVDQLPHMLAALLMFGHQLLLPVPDIDRTDSCSCSAPTRWSPTAA